MPRAGTAFIFFTLTMKNRIIKLRALLFIIIIVSSLCGCAGGFGYEGKELVDKAAKLHTALDAAQITVHDDILDIDAQYIAYRFTGEVMQYMYIGREEEEDGSLREYYEYNNGTELDRITLPDESEWSFVTKGSADYYGYSRISRHYFSDGEKLFSDYDAAVKSALTVPDAGGTRLSLEYDEEKLSLYQSLAGVSGYSAYFVFDGEGYCTRFSSSYTMDGKKRGYTVTIRRLDPSREIPREEPQVISSSS